MYSFVMFHSEMRRTQNKKLWGSTEENNNHKSENVQGKIVIAYAYSKQRYNKNNNRQIDSQIYGVCLRINGLSKITSGIKFDRQRDTIDEHSQSKPFDLKLFNLKGTMNAFITK